MFFEKTNQKYFNIDKYLQLRIWSLCTTYLMQILFIKIF